LNLFFSFFDILHTFSDVLPSGRSVPILVMKAAPILNSEGIIPHSFNDVATADISIPDYSKATPPVLKDSKLHPAPVHKDSRLNPALVLNDRVFNPDPQVPMRRTHITDSDIHNFNNSSHDISVNNDKIISTKTGNTHKSKKNSDQIRNTATINGKSKMKGSSSTKKHNISSRTNNIAKKG
jgi:hypothetical protein